MHRRSLVVAVVTVAIVSLAAPAFACGGLIGANGAVNLLRTTTLAGYHAGVEHYITSFTFAGVSEGAFGSIVPLPGVPTVVERGGDWTLQRLQREIAPASEDVARFAAGGAATTSAKILLETRIDALDITILEGGADEVGRWAREEGFALPPDAPEVLRFYASRSPIFMAARFDTAAALERGFQAGDGTPIHLAIPTPNPWVPLRILGLGKQASEIVSADVFLLTERAPALLPQPRDGLTLERSERASASLMADLRADAGNDWIPDTPMWLSHLRLEARASSVTYDLAVDASGFGTPSPVAAGLGDVLPPRDGWVGPILLALLVAAAVAIIARAGRAEPAFLR